MTMEAPDPGRTHLGGKGRDDDDTDNDDVFGDLEGLDDLMGGNDDDEKKETKKRPAASSGRGPMKKPSRKNEDVFEAWFWSLQNGSKIQIKHSQASNLFLPVFLSPMCPMVQAKEPLPFEYMIEKKDEKMDYSEYRLWTSIVPGCLCV